MAKQESLKSRRDEAEKLVREISQQLEKAEYLTKQSLNKLNDTVATNNKYKKYFSKINGISRSAEDSIDKIRDNRSKLSTLLTSVNKFYEKKYKPLYEEIENPERGFKATIKKGEEFVREIKKIRENQESEIKLIKGLVSDSRKNLQEIKRIDSSIRKVEKNILEKERKVINNEDIIEQAKIKVEAARDRILEIEKTSNEKEVEIIRLHTSSENLTFEITSFHKKASDTLDKIREIYEISGSTGLGGEFKLRKEDLENEVLRWKRLIFKTTVVLSTIVISLFVLQLFLYGWNLKTIQFDGNFYSRFLITSPIIFYLTFVTTQFNKSSLSLEKYAFKAALALSIDAHINLLTNIDNIKDKEHIDLIAKFILDGFKKIHDEPYDLVKEKADSASNSLLSDILNKVNLLSNQSSKG